MAFQDALTAGSEKAETDETANEGAPESPAGSEISPFSMSYDMSSYDVDAETTDQMLSVLVAATNLL